MESPHPYRFHWFDWFCLWYPPGWLILFNRHWQHYHPDPDGWNWLEYLLFLLPGGFYLALLIRWLRLGCRAPRNDDSPLDPAYQQALRTELLAPILTHYFRAELHQAEQLPTTPGPLLIAMNHAGMCFPWDFLGLGVLLSQQRGWVVLPLAHPIFFDHPWLRWWLPPGWSRVLGGVPAERSHFESAVADLPANSVVLYAPEGWRGLIKGWHQRYQLTTFDTSFVQLSDRHQIPILPVACLGNESLHPWSWNARRLGRWLGLPLFPLSPLILAFILFPSMGVWANRTRLRYFIQAPIQPWKQQPASTTRIAYQQAQKVRSHLQAQLNQLRHSNQLTAKG